MIVAEKIIRSLFEKYGKHTLYIQMVVHGMMKHACNVLRLKHYLHSSLEKSLMERVNQPVFERQNRMF
jgi:putative transposase